jgi:hypothetical protein
MSWAKVDDRANEHRKQLEAGAEACWLWTCGLMYANRQDARDGFIPALVLPMLYPFRGPKKLAARLVDVGLWEKVDGGYRVHNYHQWNPTKEQVEAEREAGRRRAAESYARKHGKSSPEESQKSEPKKHDSSGSTPTPLHSTPSQPADAGSPARALDGAPDSTDSDHESPIPMDLLRRAEERGVIGDLAEKLRIPRESVEDAAREFIGYWTIGKGTGQRRRHWMAKLREHVRQRHEQGKLRAPGEIRHTGMTPIEVGPGAMSPLVRQFLTGGGR